MNGYDPYAAPPYPYGAPPPPPPLAVQPHPHQPIASTSQLPPAPTGDWTAQLGLDAMQLPPGGSILLPSAQAGLGQLPDHLAGATQLVKVTAKSCSNCRTRKVKCDRRYPECTRCIKRKEACDYGDDVSIALRPTWVVPTEEDALPLTASVPAHVPLTGPTPTARAPYVPPSLPYPIRPAAAAPSYDPYQPVRALSDLQHHQALVRKGGRAEDEEDKEGEKGFSDLWESFLKASNLGQSSSDWRLALPTMASSLTIHLIDASMHSCCFHLPAFHIFNPDIRFFKENIDQLDIASQVIVGILTSLGARASPHSALLGVAGPDIENGKASLDLVLSAGVRRENAWRAIVKRATELCSKMEILQVPSVRNLQTLVAFVQMLMLAEVQPKTARFFLRTAMGVFRDMQHAGLSPNEVQVIKLSVGPTLFESDARIAAYLSMPVCITEDDLYEYFDGTGVHVPDLANEDLGPLLDDILAPSRGLITREKLDRALGLTGYFVCAVQRAFSNVSSSRRPNTRFLTTVPQLWTYIDRAHAAVQRLHRRLVQLDYTPAGCDAHHSVDYDLLIGVRMDERLLDVVHLAHVWLAQQRKMDLTLDDRNALEDLLATSERRVRKCLKLLAFYSKVFVDSLDKHCVYHLFTQLEALPGWATMVAQREGEPTDFGPLPAECALTDVELDWFTRALELACFFTPLGNERLRDLNAARNARKHHQAPPYLAFGDYDLAAPPAAFHSAPAPVSAPVSYALAQQHPGANGSLPPAPPPPPPGSAPRPGSPSWTFDSYGTPLAFGAGPGGDSGAPTPSSTGGAGGGGGSGSAGGSPGFEYGIAAPPPQAQRYAASANGAGSPAAAGGVGAAGQPHPQQQQGEFLLPLPPTPAATSPGGGPGAAEQQMDGQQQPQQPWLAGGGGGGGGATFDYASLLGAEGRSPPGGAGVSAAPAQGAIIAELDDDAAGPTMAAYPPGHPHPQQQQPQGNGQAWSAYREW
ncbi:hypothetical protein JCM10449v2_004197 [Rhodotorula kratochvilovae]